MFHFSTLYTIIHHSLLKKYALTDYKYNYQVREHGHNSNPFEGLS